MAGYQELNTPSDSRFAVIGARRLIPHDQWEQRGAFVADIRQTIWDSARSHGRTVTELLDEEVRYLMYDEQISGAPFREVSDESVWEFAEVTLIALTEKEDAQ